MRILFLVVLLLSLALAEDVDPSKPVSAIVQALNKTRDEYRQWFQASQNGKYLDLTAGVIISVGHENIDAEPANLTYYLKDTAAAVNNTIDKVKDGLIEVLTTRSGTPDYRFTVTVTNRTAPDNNGTEGLLDEALFYEAFVVVGLPDKPNLVLYIIIGVITAAALIITAVLVISLNKKKTQPEYQPIDDYAGDKVTENY